MILKMQLGEIDINTDDFFPTNTYLFRIFQIFLKVTTI
ncbi:hypothetical protein CRE_02884 [Caenorhabditis remanei]|uniref:Uncharacterized protein n=2 Tax=Caenorhabditis remanei TaxID=31234 RepID=E3LWG3_CAERE|nr:hypothetical protein CRE_02884 [Caenorhabditis remanei]